MRTFFTADHHFGHQGVLQMCGRPFENIGEHDDWLVQSWNAVVMPGDEVWHLGDFAMGSSPERCADLFRRLNGTKRLVRGNHDKPRVLELGWESQHDLVSVTVEGQRIVLCHYPLRAWSGVWHGRIHLFGHTHGTLPDSSQSCDVGVDRWSYAPVTLAQIRERLAATPEAPEELARNVAVEAEPGDPLGYDTRIETSEDLMRLARQMASDALSGRTSEAVEAELDRIRRRFKRDDDR